MIFLRNEKSPASLRGFKKYNGNPTDYASALIF